MLGSTPMNNHPRTCPKSSGRVLCTTSPPDIWWFARDKCLRKYISTYFYRRVHKSGKIWNLFDIFLWKWNFFKVILFIHFLNHGFGYLTHLFNPTRWGLWNGRKILLKIAKNVDNHLVLKLDKVHKNIRKYSICQSNTCKNNKEKYY